MNTLLCKGPYRDSVCILDTKYIKTYYVLNMMMSRPAEEEEIHTIQINMYVYKYQVGQYGR